MSMNEIRMDDFYNAFHDEKCLFGSEPGIFETSIDASPKVGSVEWIVIQNLEIHSTARKRVRYSYLLTLTLKFDSQTIWAPLNDIEEEIKLMRGCSEFEFPDGFVLTPELTVQGLIGGIKEMLPTLH